MTESNLTTADVREHYERIEAALTPMGDLDGHPTIGLNDKHGWYITTDQTDLHLIDDGYPKQQRVAGLQHDWDTITGRIDRTLYAVTSYKTESAMLDWAPARPKDGGGYAYETDKPTPNADDIMAIAAWGDIDLADELKLQRGSLDPETQATAERTLDAYVDAYARLYGGRDAVYMLDSVGGAYIMGAPEATLPIGEAFADDPAARARIFEAFIERSNEWLQMAQGWIEGRIDGAADVIDPDWVNNINRMYKAPLSLHGDLDAVVTPVDTFDVTYEVTPADAVDDALIERTREWTSDFTALEHTDRVQRLVAQLWPDYYEAHESWEAALRAWVTDERDAEVASQTTPPETAADREVGVSEAHLTPSIREVFDAIDGLDVERVAEETIVHTWTDEARDKRSHASDGKRDFVPVWGVGASGTANYIDEKGSWVDTGQRHHGTVVEMALIAEENWPRGQIAEGRDWARGVRYLNERGFDVPIWTPDAESTGPGGDSFEQMPYWALVEAAIALDVLDRDDLVERETDDGSYEGFPDAETYNAALDAVAEAGLSHGRDPVDTDQSGSNDGGSYLFDLSMREVLRACRFEWDYSGRYDHPQREEGHNAVVLRQGDGDVIVEDVYVEYEYVPLTWLLVEAGARHPDAPKGSLSNREMWVAWRTAKEHDLVPEDDPVPYRARLHIAAEHDLAPAGLVERAADNPSVLPPSTYNLILETIREEYGLAPGLDDLETDYKDDQRAKILAGDTGDDSDADTDSKSSEIKQMLATLDAVSDD